MSDKKIETEQTTAVSISKSGKFFFNGREIVPIRQIAGSMMPDGTVAVSYTTLYSLVRQGIISSVIIPPKKIHVFVDEVQAYKALKGGKGITRQMILGMVPQGKTVEEKVAWYRRKTDVQVNRLKKAKEFTKARKLLMEVEQAIADLLDAEKKAADMPPKKAYRLLVEAEQRIARFFIKKKPVIRTNGTGRE